MVRIRAKEPHGIAGTVDPTEDVLVEPGRDLPGGAVPHFPQGGDHPAGPLPQTSSDKTAEPVESL